jgi:murein DD-endopeptidase MepM/ murein hydrolase activator NlpD
MLSAILLAITAAAASPTPALQFSWPLCGPEPAAWGYRTDPFTGRMAFHPGVDFDAPAGTPIRASARGKVIAAEPRGPYGNMVEIDHGDAYRTRYGHLARLNVSAGDLVHRGQVIGEVGATGRAKTPHLHFEIWFGDVVHDPLKHLDAEPACAKR